MEATDSIAPCRGPITIPRYLAASRLMEASRGFSIYFDLPSRAVVNRLQVDAVSALREAKHERRDRRIRSNVEVTSTSFDEDRKAGARIKRLVARGGAPQCVLYHDPEMHSFLSVETGLSLAPSGSHGIYAYYVRNNDFIGLHRDTSPFDVELITSLYDTHPDNEQGSLAIYPTRTTESCESISKTSKKGKEIIKLKPGQSMLILGGVIPHRVVPVFADQIRIVSSLSFSVKDRL
jgi:hypothetical protein